MPHSSPSWSVYNIGIPIFLFTRWFPPSYKLVICINQWEFQDPKMEVPTIYKAYCLGLFKGISPQNMALYGTVPPF